MENCSQFNNWIASRFALIFIFRLEITIWDISSVLDQIMRYFGKLTIEDHVHIYAVFILFWIETRK